MITTEKYTPDISDEWNAFVADSKNGTFLHDRRYLDYHADRFADCSTVFRFQNAIVALLPANRVGDVIHSHQGLTYGGLIVSETMKASLMLDIVDALVQHLGSLGLKSLSYTPSPHIYHRYPAEEDIYALYHRGATLVQRDALSVVRPQWHPPLQARRQRGLKKAIKAGLIFAESDDWASFWYLLEDTLKRRHDSSPVHTLNEIDQLRRSFPNNIRLYICSDSTNLVAGTVIFESNQVAKTQYIASSETGRVTGALDLIFTTLLDSTYWEKDFLDFGSSHQGEDRDLAIGLIEQKEGFGARSIVQDTYQLKIN
jgi:hypothetical protein